jgi:hypothetical protein
MGWFYRAPCHQKWQAKRLPQRQRLVRQGLSRSAKDRLPIGHLYATESGEAQLSGFRLRGRGVWVGPSSERASKATRAESPLFRSR